MVHEIEKAIPIPENRDEAKKGTLLLKVIRLEKVEWFHSKNSIIPKTIRTDLGRRVELEPMSCSRIGAI